MRRLRVGGLVPLSFCFAVATAQGVVYVTDLAIFTVLVC